jgi:hypothetical protein
VKNLQVGCHFRNRFCPFQIRLAESQLLPKPFELFHVCLLA